MTTPTKVVLEISRWEETEGWTAQIKRVRRALEGEHAPLRNTHGNLVKLALNEAEALAWASGYPELIFPLLAEEKIETAARWKQHQTAVHRLQAEIALAE